MKFLQNKYFLLGIVIVIFFIAGAIIQITKKNWVSIPKNLLNQTAANPSGTTKTIMYNGKAYQVVKQKKFSINQFSNPKMNISFTFSGSITYKQITPQLVALYDPSVKNTDDNTLYIYSATVPEDSISFKIPFTVPGSLKRTKVIKTQKFVANQETYSDGKKTITLLVLRQNQQTIVFRIPPDSSKVSETITQIMNSIQLLH